MISLFRKLWRNKRGNALVIAGAALPLLIGSAGLATDTMQWVLWKRQLQRAADSAAIAGAYARLGSAPVSSAVDKDLGEDNKLWVPLLAGYPAISQPADSGSLRYQVQV